MRSDGRRSGWPFTLKVDVAMVSLDVAVFNASGTPVTDLKREDFQIYEDGRPQQIQAFASSTSPYNVLLIIDKSGSMYTQVRFVSEAINRFFSNLRAQDQVALASFDTSVHMLVDWRSVRAGPRKKIDLGAGGNTDFYGALEWAARQLGKIRGRKAVLFFTDGADYRIYDPKPDAVAFRKALEKVRRTKTPFHFVGLDADPERGGAHLKRLAEETGGQAYFPKSIKKSSLCTIRSVVNWGFRIRWDIHRTSRHAMAVTGKSGGCSGQGLSSIPVQAGILGKLTDAGYLRSTASPKDKASVA